VLNPESQKETGIKIVNVMQRSPERLMTGHPLSNPNIFCYPLGTILVQRKGCIKDINHSTLNLNSNLGEEISIKFDPPKQKRNRSQRRHFDEYFYDNWSNKYEFA
jgi:hypothetical protein